MPTGSEAFRRWLIDRIKQTRFSVLRNEPVNELALQMGVTPEVLQRAQAEKAQELAALGRRFVGKQWRGTERKLNLWCPARIRKDIEERATRMELTSAELVRGVVRTLLSGPDNPVLLLPHWAYDGAVYLWSNKERHDVVVRLSYGAYTALRLRAQKFHATPLALVRAAVVDYLEGRMTGAYFVSSSEMWEDPNRYWTGELTRKGEYRGHTGTIAT